MTGQWDGQERRTNIIEKSDIVLIISKLDSLHEKTDKLCDCVYGKDDQPGIKGRLSLAEHSIEDMNSHRNRLYAFAASAGLLAIGSIVKSFFRH